MLYCRVSTAYQTCARQERDLRAFAKKAGYKVVGVWKETASGGKAGARRTQEGPGVGAGPQGRRDPRHRTDPLGPLGQVRRAVLPAPALSYAALNWVSTELYLT